MSNKKFINSPDFDAELAGIKRMAAGLSFKAGTARRYPKPLKERVKALLAQGVSVASIAEHCGLPVSCLNYWSANLAPRHRPTEFPEVRELVVEDLPTAPGKNETSFLLRACLGRLRIEFSF